MTDTGTAQAAVRGPLRWLLRLGKGVVAATAIFLASMILHVIVGSPRGMIGGLWLLSTFVLMTAVGRAFYNR